MTDTSADRDTRIDQDDTTPGFAGAHEATRPAVISYAVGLALSTLLTIASFYALGTRLVWAPSIPIVLVVLAVAQIGVHLVFFLHITTAPDNTNNVLALAFGILIVALIIAGSLWIMVHLNHNMLPVGEVMRMQR